MVGVSGTVATGAAIISRSMDLASLPIEQRIDRMSKRISYRIGARPEQYPKIRETVSKAIHRISPKRDKFIREAILSLEEGKKELMTSLTPRQQKSIDWWLEIIRSRARKILTKSNDGVAGTLELE